MIARPAHLSREEGQVGWPGYPWEQGRAYARWLGMVGDVLRHTERLLALSAYCLPDRQGALRRAVMAQAAAAGHEREDLIVHDLLAMGYTVLDLPEPPAVAQLHQQLAALATDGVPTAILGHVVAFERWLEASTPPVWARCIAAHGPLATGWLAWRSTAPPCRGRAIATLVAQAEDAATREGLVLGEDASHLALQRWRTASV